MQQNHKIYKLFHKTQKLFCCGQGNGFGGECGLGNVDWGMWIGECGLGNVDWGLAWVETHFQAI